MHSSSPTIKSRDGLGDNILTRTIYAEIRHWFYLCIISNEWNVMAVASSASQGPLGCTLVNDWNVPSCRQVRRDQQDTCCEHVLAKDHLAFTYLLLEQSLVFAADSRGLAVVLHLQTSTQNERQRVILWVWKVSDSGTKKNLTSDTCERNRCH